MHYILWFMQFQTLQARKFETFVVKGEVNAARFINLSMQKGEAAQSRLRPLIVLLGALLDPRAGRIGLGFKRINCACFFHCQANVIQPFQKAVLLEAIDFKLEHFAI